METPTASPETPVESILILSRTARSSKHTATLPALRVLCLKSRVHANFCPVLREQEPRPLSRALAPAGSPRSPGGGIRARRPRCCGVLKVLGTRAADQRVWERLSLPGNMTCVVHGDVGLRIVAFSQPVGCVPVRMDGCDSGLWISLTCTRIVVGGRSPPNCVAESG
jgi:hypothetical protein